MDYSPAHVARPQVRFPKDFVCAYCTFIVAIADILVDSGSEVCSRRLVKSNLGLSRCLSFSWLPKRSSAAGSYQKLIGIQGKLLTFLVILAGPVQTQEPLHLMREHLHLHLHLRHRLPQ